MHNARRFISQLLLGLCVTILLTVLTGCDKIDNPASPNYVKVRVESRFSLRMDTGDPVIDGLYDIVTSDRSRVTVILGTVTDIGSRIHPGFGVGSKLYLVTGRKDIPETSIVKFNACDARSWLFREHTVCGSKVLILDTKLRSAMSEKGPF